MIKECEKNFIVDTYSWVRSCRQLTARHEPEMLQATVWETTCTTMGPMLQVRTTLHESCTFYQFIRHRSRGIYCSRGRWIAYNCAWYLLRARWQSHSLWRGSWNVSKPAIIVTMTRNRLSVLTIVWCAISSVDVEFEYCTLRWIQDTSPYQIIMRWFIDATKVLSTSTGRVNLIMCMFW